MDQTIDKQVELIKKIIIIGKKLPSNIDRIGNIPVASGVHNIRRTIFFNIQKFYAEIFFSHASFLLEKIREEKKENFIFFVPNLRTLLEVYANLLHFLNQSDDKKAELGESIVLCQLSKNICAIPSDKKSKHLELKKQYSTHLDILKSFSDNWKLFVDPQKLPNKKKLRKMELINPEVYTIFKKNNYFENCSEYTNKVFDGKITRDSLYNFYNNLSDYVHGSFLSYSKTSKSTINEQYWLIGKVQLFSMLIIELINKKVIHNARQAELENWVKEFQEQITDFKYYWQNKKLGII
ncbi:MAG: hypothetical protein U9O20_04380 [Patescibacteria group bacterium]|nr:hypothetical protein [Patescibacteria group bacterium]